MKLQNNTSKNVLLLNNFFTACLSSQSFSYLGKDSVDVVTERSEISIYYHSFSLFSSYGREIYFRAKSRARRSETGRSVLSEGQNAGFARGDKYTKCYGYL